MFKGEEFVTLSTTQPEAAVYKTVEEALSTLGRVRIDKRGGIEIEAKDKLKSFLTDTTLDGGIRKKGDGYEVSVGYSCKPTVANWIILTVGTLLCVGLNWLAILGPIMDKKKVGKAVGNALHDLEDERPG